MALTGQTGSVAWIVIVPDDLYSRLNGGQTDALRTAALGTDQTAADAVFNSVMPDVTNRIRQYIASNPRNRLSQTPNAVPPELKWMSVWLTLQDMIARLSIALPLNQDQAKQVTTANHDLDLLREIKPPFLAVSTPVDPEPNPELTVSSPAYVVSADRRQMTRCSLRGL